MHSRKTKHTVIAVGEDALGQWAWMLLTRDGDLIGSGHRLDCAAVAIEEAMCRWIDEVTKRTGRVPDLPTVIFP